MSTAPSAAQAALARLREGNHRFTTGTATTAPRWDREKMRDQRPFATVIGCSDSRAPAEFLFDVDLGDLFVIRIAGNIVAPSQIGSVEFSVGSFDVPLVVVMGHTQCGAITAAVNELEGQAQPASTHLSSITSRIKPFIEPVVRAPRQSGAPRSELIRTAMRANVRASVAQLIHSSRLLEEAVAAGKLQIVGAEYELETGRVAFLDVG